MWLVRRRKEKVKIFDDVGDVRWEGKVDDAVVGLARALGRLRALAEMLDKSQLALGSSETASEKLSRIELHLGEMKAIAVRMSSQHPKDRREDP